MKINGWDITEIGAEQSEQWNVIPGFHAVSNDSEWIRGSPTPILFKNKIGFKTLKVTILVRANRDRQAILSQCSEILSRLQEPVELELDDFEHKFYGILSKHTLEENPLNIPWVKYNRASKLILEFNVYEYADVEFVEASGKTEIAVNNPGNILTPAIIEITPQVGVASITLTGICRDPNTGEDLPVIINEMKSGKTVILDGETGLFTQDGELKNDIEIWDVPTLLPGGNTITVNNEWMDIAVRYRPRFM